MKPKFKCCVVETACGRNLRQEVVFVGVATLVISAIVLVLSVSFMVSMASSELPYNSNPVVAINLVFVLVSTSISSYQIVISLLLLWQAYRIRNKVYFYSLWYVSHLSILSLYFLLFIAKVVICFNAKYYARAVITILVGIAYQAIFTYFVIIVNSYILSLNEDRYF